EVAVRYQMYHALGLILVGILLRGSPSRWLTAAAVLLLAGTILFSGGVYGWLATGIKPLVHVVPLGGTLWIVSWFVLAVGVFRQDRYRPRNPTGAQQNRPAGAPNRAPRRPSEASWQFSLRHTATNSSSSFASRLRATCNRRLMVPTGERN